MASRVFRSTALIAVVGGAGLLSAACTIPTETAEATTSVEVSPLSTVAADVPAALTGKVVFLDPGHSGGRTTTASTPRSPPRAAAAPRTARPPAPTPMPGSPPSTPSTGKSRAWSRANSKAKAPQWS